MINALRETLNRVKLKHACKVTANACLAKQQALSYQHDSFSVYLITNAVTVFNIFNILTTRCLHQLLGGGDLFGFSFRRICSFLMTSVDVNDDNMTAHVGRN